MRRIYSDIYKGDKMRMETKETVQVNNESVFNVKDLSVSYGDFVAIKNVNMDIY